MNSSPLYPQQQLDGGIHNTSSSSTITSAHHHNPSSLNYPHHSSHEEEKSRISSMDAASHFTDDANNVFDNSIKSSQHAHSQHSHPLDSSSSMASGQHSSSDRIDGKRTGKSPTKIPYPGLLFRRRRSQLGNLDLTSGVSMDTVSTHSSEATHPYGGDAQESIEETVRIEKMFWTAIEREDCETVKSILSDRKNLVNRVNAFNLQPLDMACVLGLEAMMMLLLEHGAVNNPSFFFTNESDSKERLTNHLSNCLQELTNRLNFLRESEECGNVSLKDQLLEEIELVEERSCILSNARYGLQALPQPPEPSIVEVEVGSTTSLLVIIQAPASEFMVTQYQIRWYQEAESCTESVKNGSVLVSAHYPQGFYDIEDLETDKTYSLKVYSWNLAGYSVNPCNGKPSRVRLSTWFSHSEHRDRTTTDKHVHELSAMQGEIQQELCSWLTSTSNATASTQSLGHTHRHLMSSIRQKSPPTSNAPHRKKTFRQLFSMGSTISSLPGRGGESGSGSGGNTFSFKFTRHVKKGVYIGLLYSNLDKILLLEDSVPFFQVDSDESVAIPATVQADAHWLMRLLASQLDLKILSQNLSQLYSDLPTSLQSRVKLLLAAQQLQTIMGTVTLGEILPEVICRTNCCVLLLVHQLQYTHRDFQTISTNNSNLKWAPFSKLERRIQQCPSGLDLDHLGVNKCSPAGSSPLPTTSAEDEMYGHLEEMVQRHSGKMYERLEPGLYVAYLRLRLWQDQLQILNPVNSSNILPTSIIRENNHVTREEWEALKTLSEKEKLLSQSLPETLRVFVRTIHMAWNKLAIALRLSNSEREECRLYLGEIFSLGRNVAFLIVTHNVDTVCLPQTSTLPWSPMDFQFSHFAAFEHWLFYTYEHTFYSLYATLSSILDVLLPLALKCQRQSFHDAEVHQNKYRVEIFMKFQQRLEEIWAFKRWTKDIIIQSRGMKSDNILPDSINYISQWLSIHTMSEAIESWYAYKTAATVTSPIPSYVKESDVHLDGSGSPMPTPPNSTNTSRRGSLTSTQAAAAVQNPSEGHPSGHGVNSGKVLQGSLRIYAGYPCGLVEGTSVRLQVTSVTTAREIVNLVVKKLSSLKGATVSVADEELPFYGLAVALGKLEKLLPDPFHPLLLQPPWSKGKLLIRKYKTMVNASSTSTSRSSS